MILDLVNKLERYFSLSKTRRDFNKLNKKPQLRAVYDIIRELEKFHNYDVKTICEMSGTITNITSGNLNIKVSIFDDTRSEDGPRKRITINIPECETVSFYDKDSVVLMSRIMRIIRFSITECLENRKIEQEKEYLKRIQEQENKRLELLKKQRIERENLFSMAARIKNTRQR